MTALTWDSPASQTDGRTWGGRASMVQTSPASPAEKLHGPFGEETFILLANQDPRALVELLSQGLVDQPHLLTFAGEAAGQMEFAMAIGPLLQLLAHPHPVVREGAILGLAPHLAYSLPARDALRRLASRDASPGVRMAAADALENVG